MTRRSPAPEPDPDDEDPADDDALGSGSDDADETGRGAGAGPATVGRWFAGSGLSNDARWLTSYQKSFVTPELRATIEAMRKTVAATVFPVNFTADVAALIGRAMDPDGQLARQMREVIAPGLNQMLSNLRGVQVFQEGVASSLQSWVEQVRLIPTNFWERAFPPNLRGLEDLSFEAMGDLAADAITVYAAPRAQIAARLLRAKTVARQT